MSNKLLNKKAIIEAKDFVYEDVLVPEWGGSVRVAVMSAFEKDKFEASVIGKNGGMNHVNIRAKLVAACLVDELGELMFKDEKDVLALGKKSCKALDRVFEVATKLNRMDDKDIEQLAKN